ncbi:MAG: AAA family ATPase, partial [Zoogloeaceae bacterium]|nr:AAA family ATPase [Zoogloeaceae bacterium]
MTHLFAEPATRFFALYGNTDDIIVTPRLRALDLRQWLAEYCQSLGYRRVIFYSGDKQIHFIDKVSAYLAQPARKDQGEKAAPAGRRGFRVLEKHGVPPGYPRLGMGRRAKPEDLPAASDVSMDDVPMAIHGDDAQTGRRLDSYMRDAEIPTALIFQHAEEVTNSVDGIDQDARRFWNRHFDDWKRLSNNRNICICVFGREPDPDHFRPGVLRERFINRDGKWFTHNCFNIGAARQDEVGHWLDILRLKGDLAWMPEKIERAAQPLAQSLTPDGVNESLLTLYRLRDRLLKPGNAPPALDDPWAELRAMPALDRQVGEKLRKLVEDAKRQQKQEKRATSTPPPACMPLLVERLRPPRKPSGDNAPNLHLALLGSPGTGKTTLARLIGRIYKREGVLSSGHFIEASAKDLAAGYVGQTAIKTDELIQRARGGVLFIDEAYELAKKEGTFADECVAGLVAAMTRDGDFAI